SLRIPQFLQELLFKCALIRTIWRGGDSPVVGAMRRGTPTTRRIFWLNSTPARPGGPLPGQNRNNRSDRAPQTPIPACGSPGSAALSLPCIARCCLLAEGAIAFPGCLLLPPPPSRRAVDFSSDPYGVCRRLPFSERLLLQPRVNGAIPDLNNATLDHKRLSERLTTYGLAELQIEGDGNCQFRAIADQLFRNPEYHKHLKHFQKLYEGYVPMSYKGYLKKMKRRGEWGDHVTLQAAADRFGVKICLLTSFRDTCLIEIIPKDQNPSRGTLYLCRSGSAFGVKYTTIHCMQLMMFPHG
ncbi:hypothetical protein Taro_020588, partial [Colocasia esculenta]|nr:hypothetical protein [Colocasia esculenta]